MLFLLLASTLVHKTYLCDGRVALEALGQGLYNVSTKPFATKIQFLLVRMLHQHDAQSICVVICDAMSVNDVHIAKQSWQKRSPLHSFTTESMKETHRSSPTFRIQFLLAK